MITLMFLKNPVAVSSATTYLTPNMQKLALFQFKLSLAINPSASTYDCDIQGTPSRPKTMNWSMDFDCCTWDGVTCDQMTGDVIGLDLSCSQLVGAILPNSTLFQLSQLNSLNLAFNDFSLSNNFPREFGFFATGLKHLDLSHTGFVGSVPSGISHLYKLVSLDLSEYSSKLQTKLEGKLLDLLLHNLTQLRVLDLHGVDISSVLPINMSTSLRHLNLGDTGLHGELPQMVFHLPKLEVLSLSGNTDLTSILPKVKWGSSGSLQEIYLGNTYLTGGIPDSIGYLGSLTTLILSNCKLSGPIPTSMGNLTRLSELDLTSNRHLSGQIPDLANLTNLRVLDLSVNNLSGTFPSWVTDLGELTSLSLAINSLTGPLPSNSTGFRHQNMESLQLNDNNFIGPFPTWVANLRQLSLLTLTGNLLNGSIPSWLFELPSLTMLHLDRNHFTGQLNEFNFSKSELQIFNCKNNLLYGHIPNSLSRLVGLSFLDLSSNNFSGVLDIEMFFGLQNLKGLLLSHNSLSLRSTSMIIIPPKLTSLSLASCKLKEFPHFLRGAVNMEDLDLSNNQINGEIPQWFGLVGRDAWYYLNLSQNSLTGGLEYLPWNSLAYLNLQFNMLSGSLPSSICNSYSLAVLDLSYNNLSGVLPSCLGSLAGRLLVFDLRMNNIQGNLPSTLSNFSSLRTLNLHGNKLEGTIPPSFSKFDNLEVLDLGSNHINDMFPHHLETLPNLQVLVLRSNKFHGFIYNNSKIDKPFPSLRIIDLSYNEFAGPLPAKYIKNFKSMMNSDVDKMAVKYMGFSTYSDSTTLVVKGVEIQYDQILTTFTTIDLSSNKFEGGIPEYIGSLKSLRYLNLSHNHLTGYIPSLIGGLSVLESLDLSSNRLEGEIPQQLKSLNFLSRLNLSQNGLSGHIPEGAQFNTFENDSFVGNLGLCGHPLSKKCEREIETNQEEKEDDDYFFNGFTWKAVVIGYGCGVVPGFIVGYLIFLAGKPKWFVGIIARELGLKVRRMEIRIRYNKEIW